MKRENIIGLILNRTAKFLEKLESYLTKVLVLGRYLTKKEKDIRKKDFTYQV